MTEPVLPPRAATPHYAPTAEGYDGVYRRSRAIRLRKALAAGGGAGTLALVLVAALLMPGGGDATDQLVTTSPTPTASAAQPTASPRGAEPTPGTQATPATPRATQPSAAGTPGATGPSLTPPAAQQPGAVPEVGPPHQDVAYDAGRVCDGAGPTPATGWCSYYDGARAARSGTSAVLATSVCRLPGQPSGTLSFGDGLQADFAVGPQSYPAEWTWSKGHRFTTEPSRLTVSPGRCVRWLVTWGVRDDAGRPLAPGDYYVDARPHEVETGTSVRTDNPVTFTVTS